ncbi:MAG: CDGSH iron-sulfur domain-containing protein [Stenotrophobium sp.]
MKVREYNAEGITILYDIRRCIHARECVHGLPKVFDPVQRVWIDATQAGSNDIATVVQRCPSGALHFLRKDGGAPEAIAESNEIHISADGPLHLRGDLEIHTRHGVIRETRATLCRCGASRNKPFCDRSHERVGFHDPGILNADSAATEPCSGPVRVLPQTNGPYWVEGLFVLSDSSGAHGMRCGPRTSLCRCGHSGKKPFCDGSHTRVGFKDE